MKGLIYMDDLYNNDFFLAKRIVHQSCCIKKSEKVLIELNGFDGIELVKYIVREIYIAEGIPYVRICNEIIERELLTSGNKESYIYKANIDKEMLNSVDVCVYIKSSSNVNELVDVPDKVKKEYREYYTKEVKKQNVNNQSRWVSIRYPNSNMAQLAGMSTGEFKKLFYKSSNLDYEKYIGTMEKLKLMMEMTEIVRIKGVDTDLSFSIKGMPIVICLGEHNIPDGEIYTAPIRDSVNGDILFNVDSMHEGVKFQKIKLKCVDGEIVKASSAMNNNKLQEILNYDEGARYIGEFALGINPYINKVVKDITFDEKINGSFHLTPGACYSDTDNGNYSIIHWDLVCIQTKEYGGGEIYFDDKLVRKDGKFISDELELLNEVL